MSKTMEELAEGQGNEPEKGTTPVAEQPAAVDDPGKILGDPNGFYMTAGEMAEFQALTDPEEIKRAMAHRKACKKAHKHPTPPSNWVKCGLCDYRTPGSLVSHITAEHGSLAEYARTLGILPEMVQLVSDELMDEFKRVGATSKDALAQRVA